MGLFVIFFIFAVGVVAYMALKGSKRHSQNRPTPASTNVDYPISEEQLHIFKKNWSLPEFRKQFGKEKEIRLCTNHSTFVSYKCCIFGSSTWVRFASSLEELSLEDIKIREKELMIGLSKEKERYVLYDNKIKIIDLIDLPGLFEDDNIDTPKISTEDTSVPPLNSNIIPKSNKVEAGNPVQATVQTKEDSKKKGTPIVNTLTMKQKEALLGLAATLSDEYCVSNKRKEAKEILNGYRFLLGLSENQLNNVRSYPAWKARNKYAGVVKTITWDEPYIQFIDICYKLVEIEKEDNIFMNYNFYQALKCIGFSDEDSHDIRYNKKYNYKFQKIGD